MLGWSAARALCMVRIDPPVYSLAGLHAYTELRPLSVSLRLAGPTSNRSYCDCAPVVFSFIPALLPASDPVSRLSAPVRKGAVADAYLAVA